MLWPLDEDIDIDEVSEVSAFVYENKYICMVL